MTADFVPFVYYEVSIPTTRYQINKVLPLCATMYHSEIIYEQNALKW